MIITRPGHRPEMIIVEVTELYSGQRSSESCKPKHPGSNVTNNKIELIFYKEFTFPHCLKKYLSLLAPEDVLLCKS